MQYLKINGKEIGPYLGIMDSRKNIKGNILPIVYDSAVLELSNSFRSFSLGYKFSKNLIGQEINYADLIDEQTGETFSFQVNNIFVIKIVDNDPHLIALVGDKLKLYKNFGKSEVNIEPDGDKKDMVPLGYYDTFVSYDDDYFYPLILDKNKDSQKNIERFYDYYGFKAYTDSNGEYHLYMLIEGEDSNDILDAWYFVDNFRKISKRIDFGDDNEYIEKWSINEFADIYMTTTSGQTWYLDKITGTPIKGAIPKTDNFNYVRYFEDTDSVFIVGKNDKGVFIIDRTKTNISNEQQRLIKYFKDVHGRVLDGDIIYFFMEQESGCIDLVDVKGKEITHTDLSNTDKIKSSKIIDKKILEVLLESGEKRKYLI